jgi:hypothetical protein
VTGLLNYFLLSLIPLGAGFTYKSRSLSHRLPFQASAGSINVHDGLPGLFALATFYFIPCLTQSVDGSVNQSLPGGGCLHTLEATILSDFGQCLST